MDKNAKEVFEKSVEAGKQAANEGYDDLLWEIYNRLYLIPDELKTPIAKLGDVLFSELEKILPEETSELIQMASEEERVEEFKAILGVAVLQFLVGLKARARNG